MNSFFDVFKWDRFVAPSAMELLFWLFAAIAVLTGLWGLASGIAMTESDAVPGLLLIAVSIIGTIAGIVAARVACEAIVILFRVNENLMDIAERGIAIGAPPIVESEAVRFDRRAADVRDRTATRAETVVERPAIDHRPAETGPANRPETRERDPFAPDHGRVEPKAWDVKPVDQKAAPVVEIEPVEPPAWLRQGSADTRGAAAAPAEPKEARGRAADARASEHRQAERAGDARGADARSAEQRPIEAKPAEARPVEARTAEAKPIEAKPIEAKAVEGKTAEARSGETRPVEAKPAQAKTVDARPVDTRPSEPKPAEQRPPAAIELPDRSEPRREAARRPPLRTPDPLIEHALKRLSEPAGTEAMRASMAQELSRPAAASSGTAVQPAAPAGRATKTRNPPAEGDDDVTSLPAFIGTRHAAEDEDRPSARAEPPIELPPAIARDKARKRNGHAANPMPAEPVRPEAARSEPAGAEAKPAAAAPAAKAAAPAAGHAGAPGRNGPGGKRRPDSRPGNRGGNAPLKRRRPRSDD